MRNKFSITNFESASFDVACRCRLLSTLIIIVAICPAAFALPPQIVRWQIEATVNDITDPLGLFPDVRLGDPVRGTLTYDLTLFANPLYSQIPIDLYFTNDVWAAVTTMVVENPRDGTELRFETDINGDYADVEVFSDYPDAIHGDFDGFITWQSVAPPLGYVGLDPVVTVAMTGPTTILPSYDPNAFFVDIHPPGELTLDDWPIATMEFWDGSFQDPTATNIEAIIYSLTPITESQVPGDFNFDGRVDGVDLFGWREEYGNEPLPYSDADDDGDVDGRDFLIWQRNYGSGSAPQIVANSVVPEPYSILYFAIAILQFVSRRVADFYVRKMN